MPPPKKKKAASSSQKKGDGAGVNEIEETERKTKAAKAFAYFKETQNEERDFNEFQQQREKLNYFWIVEKKKLEDSKADLRNKEREVQDLEEKRQVEIKAYKQRLKHLLYENQDDLATKKYQVEAALKASQDSHRVNEINSKGDRRTLKLNLKEMELSYDELKKNLKQDHDKNISSLRHEFERRASEVQKRYETQTKAMRAKMEEARKRETSLIEKAKNLHIQNLMSAHVKAFADIKNYYNDITHNNLDLIKSLKEEVGEMRRKEQQDEKQMEHVALENRRMSEPLKKAKTDLENLKGELGRYEAEKSELRATKARLLVVESKYKSLEWENEVLKQRYEDSASQRDSLRSKFEEVVADVKQKSQFKSLVLEKKIESLSELLEARDAQLDATLARANVDIASLGGRRKNNNNDKEFEMRDLNNELSRVAKAHSTLVQAVEEKMTELGVPTAELGFTPLVMVTSSST